MNRFIYCFFVFLFLIGITVSAQETGHGSTEQQKRQVLGMSAQQYALFSKEVKRYNKSSVEILQDKSMTTEEKKAALDKVRVQKSAYIDSHLNEEQRKRLFAFEKNAGRSHSPREKQQKALEERLKKKGIKVKDVN